MRRRDFLANVAMLAGTGVCGLPGRGWAQSSLTSAGAAAGMHDWDWLVGGWTVWHRRLKERLVDDTRWEEFAGRSEVWSTLGGFGTIDDNIVELPGDTYRGLSIRAFDPSSGKWAIWWLDGRNPTHIDPPVRGGFERDTGTFVGHDTFKSKPITVRFRWRDIHGPRPWWEQAFSPDDGASWEVNWRNYFTRTSAQPSPLPRREDAPLDWDFLVGQWNVRHRRLRQRLVGNKDWDEFDGTLVNWPVLGGHGNVGDNVMHLPGETVRGVSIRTLDPTTRQWSSWWLDTRTPAEIAAPLRGGFVGDTGRLAGDGSYEGRPVKTRVTWSRITERSARWEQASSANGGATWETNWISEFRRRVSPDTSAQ